MMAEEQTGSGTSFDAQAHLTKIKGKDYLEVKWRLVWFRAERALEAGWGIRTIAEEVTTQQARYRAQVVDPEGRIVAEGTKTETPKGFPDYVEKAETGAIGRALAICGYGTQFTGDELAEGERIVDSPLDRSQRTTQTQTPANTPAQDDFPDAGAAAPARLPRTPSPAAAKLKAWQKEHGLSGSDMRDIVAEAGLARVAPEGYTDEHVQRIQATARSMGVTSEPEEAA